MNIRSITCFVAIGDDGGREAITDAGRLAGRLRAGLEAAGFPVQTIRLATQPLSHLPGEPLSLAADLWPCCAEAGFDYLSLGPVLADTADADLTALDRLPDLIRATETVFAGVLLARQGAGLHLGAVERTARVIRDIAHTTAHGFGNLRLAALTNVGPHAPFFPAAPSIKAMRRARASASESAVWEKAATARSAASTAMATVGGPPSW